MVCEPLPSIATSLERNQDLRFVTWIKSEPLEDSVPSHVS